MITSVIQSNVLNIKNSKILCFGELLWDELPGGRKPGGAPMNAAIHLHNLGHEAILAGRVGNDEAGRELIQFMKKSGLSTRLVGVDESLPTSRVLIRLDENRNATYDICEPVAWDNLQLTEALQKESQEAGILIFGSLASRNPVTRTTLLRLLDTRALKIMDVNLRKPYDNPDTAGLLLEKASMAKLNEEEMAVIAGWHNRETTDMQSMMQWLAGHYSLDRVCVTRGSEGAALLSEGEFFCHPGYRVTAVDTVGSGDAFLAGLVAALLERKTAPEALAFACALGALTASRAGATPVFEKPEILRFMNAAGWENE